MSSSVNSKLLKQFIVLMFFYLSLGIIVYSFVPSSDLPHWLAFVKLDVETELTSNNQLKYVVLSIISRSEVVWRYLIFGFALALVSIGIIYSYWYLSRTERKSSDKWKNLFVTLSFFPRPLKYRSMPARVRMQGLVLAKPQQMLLDELVGFAYDHKSWFIGEGHGDQGLYEHTLAVIEKALNFEGGHRLLVLAAGAHDLGKVETFGKSDGEWVRIKSNHDFYSSVILRSMPSWDSLPEPDRRCLYLAVKYEHNPENLPLSISTTTEAELADANDLLLQLRTIDGLVSEEEAVKTIELSKDQINKAVIDEFINFIKYANFYTSSGRKDSVGYRWDNKVYIFEHSLRSWLVEKMDRKITVPLGLEFKTKQGISKGISHVLGLLDEIGYLVVQARMKTGSIYSIPSDCALWDISVGTQTMKAMIVVEIPQDASHLLPGQSPFEVSIQSPFRMNKATRLETVSADSSGPIEEFINEKPPTVISGSSGSIKDDVHRRRRLREQSIETLAQVSDQKQAPAQNQAPAQKQAPAQNQASDQKQAPT